MILSIETATQSCSVALHQQGKLLAAQVLHKAKSHAAHLTSMIDNLLALAGRPALAAVAVSQGPGSYTGLRIGLTTAQGICLASKLPLITLHTLAMMTYGIPHRLVPSTAYYCPMLDAKNKAVYTAVYDRDRNILTAPTRISLDTDYFSKLSKARPLVCFGNGSDAYRHLLPINVYHIPACHPDARQMGTMAYQKYKTKAFADVGSCEPMYLGQPIAARKG